MFSDEQKRKNSLSAGRPVLKHTTKGSYSDRRKKNPDRNTENVRKENPGKGKYEQKLSKSILFSGV